MLGNIYAVVFLYERGGKVLSVSRKDNLADFGLPGGKVDLLESPEVAMVREMKEETGLEITGLRHVVTLPEGDRLVAVFTGGVLGGISSDEGHVIKYCDWEELFRGSFGDYNRSLYRYLGY